MSDVQEQIAEGYVCKDCGEYLDGESPGYERLCEWCEMDQDQKARR